MLIKDREKPIAHHQRSMTPCWPTRDGAKEAGQLAEVGNIILGGIPVGVRITDAYVGATLKGHTRRVLTSTNSQVWWVARLSSGNTPDELLAVVEWLSAPMV